MVSGNQEGIVLSEFKATKVLHIGTIVSAIEQAGSNSEARQIAENLIDALPMKVLKNFQQFFVSTDVEMNYYKALGRLKHIFTDWRDLRVNISTDTILAAYFVSSLFVNSIHSAGKVDGGALIPITSFRDEMETLIDSLLATKVDDVSILDGPLAELSMEYFILHLGSDDGSIVDISKLSSENDEMKKAFGDFARCQANQVRLKTDKKDVDDALKDCKAYNMIANIQKIRMF